MSEYLLQNMTLSVMTLRNESKEPVAFAERVEAVSRAGFGGMGIRLADYQQPGVTLDQIEASLEAHGVRASEVEFLRSWVGQHNDPGYRMVESRLFEMADRLDVRQLNVGVFSPHSRQEVVVAFKGLCRRAAVHGLFPLLEFMPYTPPVDSLPEARSVLEEADEPNAGLLIDAWHFTRTSGSEEALAVTPSEYIRGIQLGDVISGPLPDIVDEARHHRAVPGEGVLDLRGFMDMLGQHGVSAPVSVEVMSGELDAMPSIDAAQRVADGLRRAFDATKLV